MAAIDDALLSDDDFIQDVASSDDDEAEAALQLRIDEETAKFRQTRMQAAARLADAAPWMPQRVGSPGVEHVRKAAAAAAERRDDDDGDDSGAAEDAPRKEFVPPPRPQLARLSGDAGGGVALAHLAPPQPGLRPPSQPPSRPTSAGRPGPAVASRFANGSASQKLQPPEAITEIAEENSGGDVRTPDQALTPSSLKQQLQEQPQAGGGSSKAGNAAAKPADHGVELEGEGHSAGVPTPGTGARPAADAAHTGPEAAGLSWKDAERGATSASAPVQKGAAVPAGKGLWVVGADVSMSEIGEPPVARQQLPISMEPEASESYSEDGKTFEDGGGAPVDGTGEAPVAAPSAGEQRTSSVAEPVAGSDALLGSRAESAASQLLSTRGSRSGGDPAGITARKPGDLAEPDVASNDSFKARNLAESAAHASLDLRVEPTAAADAGAAPALIKVPTAVPAAAADSNNDNDINVHEDDGSDDVGGLPTFVSRTAQTDSFDRMHSRTAQTDTGERMHPCEFALQLMAHDLRMLPVAGSQPCKGPGSSRAATAAAVVRPRSAPPRPASVPPSTGALFPAPAPGAAPDGHMLVQITARGRGGGRHGAARPASASPYGAARRRPGSGNGDPAASGRIVAASRALRNSPSMRDQMTEAPAGSDGDGVSEDVDSKAPAASTSDDVSHGSSGGGGGKAAACAASGGSGAPRRRPSSARPGNATPRATYVPPASVVRRSQQRPQSARPTTGRRPPLAPGEDAGAWRDVAPGGDPYLVECLAGTGTHGGQGHIGAPAGWCAARGETGTAMVNVGGVAVSVYVSDTLKRICDANRWMAQLGHAGRYRLKNPYSATHVQLVSPVLAGGAAEGEIDEDGDWLDDAASGAGWPGHAATTAVAAAPLHIAKSLPLAHFMAMHARLKTAAAAAGTSPQRRPCSSGGIGGSYSAKRAGSLSLSGMPTGGAAAATGGSANGAAALARTRSEAFRQQWLMGGGAAVCSEDEVPDAPAAVEGLTREAAGQLAMCVHSDVRDAAARARDLAQRVSMLRSRTPYGPQS